MQSNVPNFIFNTPCSCGGKGLRIRGHGDMRSELGTLTPLNLIDLALVFLYHFDNGSSLST